VRGIGHVNHVAVLSRDKTDVSRRGGSKWYVHTNISLTATFQTNQPGVPWCRGTTNAKSFYSDDMLSDANHGHHSLNVALSNTTTKHWSTPLPSTGQHQYLVLVNTSTEVLINTSTKNWSTPVPSTGQHHYQALVNTSTWYWSTPVPSTGQHQYQVLVNTTTKHWSTALPSTGQHQYLVLVNTSTKHWSTPLPNNGQHH